MTRVEANEILELLKRGVITKPLSVINEALYATGDLKFPSIKMNRFDGVVNLPPSEDRQDSFAPLPRLPRK